MTDKERHKDGRPVPSRPLSRLAGLGGMAANIAGGMALKGVRQLASGKRPRAADLLLTPANARKLTDQLSNMRGAAMKIGQMISMDSSDFLPPEFSEILGRLRADAHNMPRAQLGKVLQAEWGDDWPSQFMSFEYDPMAVASIGQVHRAYLPNGDSLAIKVQYPGVKDSIDSDVNNVAALLRMSGLVPTNLNVKPIIEEGRRQLHQEADYKREADYLCRFRALLSGDKGFDVPEYYPDLSIDKVLTMSYIEGVPVETMMDAPQDIRDSIMHKLIDLTLRELFVFKMMQTDPNFANYRYNQQTNRIVLLDFGASRDISADMASAYRHFMSAMVCGDINGTFQAAIDMGFMPADIPPKTQWSVIDMIAMAIEPFSHDEVFDFGNNQIALDLRDKGMELAANRDLWHLPPADTVFIQRKLGGMYMLATRLRARVNIHAVMRRYVVE